MRHEPRRFLADTNHLSAAAVGALVRLRDKMIISGGRLPDDNRMLARIAQIRNPKTFARLRAEIGIKPLGDGTVTREIVQPRSRRNRPAPGPQRASGGTGVAP